LVPQGTASITVDPRVSRRTSVDAGSLRGCDAPRYRRSCDRVTSVQLRDSLAATGSEVRPKHLRHTASSCITRKQAPLRYRSELLPTVGVGDRSILHDVLHVGIHDRDRQQLRRPLAGEARARLRSRRAPDLAAVQERDDRRGVRRAPGRPAFGAGRVTRSRARRLQRACPCRRRVAPYQSTLIALVPGFPPPF
jgi:hypothetical protein